MVLYILQRAFEALCHSTHLYGRRLVLEWAEMAEDLEDVRKRTAEHFHDGKFYFSPARYLLSALFVP